MHHSHPWGDCKWDSVTIKPLILSQLLLGSLSEQTSLVPQPLFLMHPRLPCSGPVKPPLLSGSAQICFLQPCIGCLPSLCWQAPQGWVVQVNGFHGQITEWLPIKTKPWPNCPTSKIFFAWEGDWIWAYIVFIILPICPLQTQYFKSSCHLPMKATWRHFNILEGTCRNFI